MVGLLDTENLEYFVLGDLNVDFKKSAKSSCRDKLDEIFDIYGIHQLISQLESLKNIVEFDRPLSD